VEPFAPGVAALPRCAFDQSELAALARRYPAERFPSGAVIFPHGRRPDAVYVLQAGRVELSVQNGGRRVAVQILRPVAVFGDIAVLTGRRDAFDACALDDTTVLALPGRDVLALLETRPALARRWLLSFAWRAAELQARLLAVLSGQVEDRLALLLLGHLDGDVVRLSQTTLAQLLGVHRSSISRALKAMEAEGAVELGYRCVRVRDVEKLSGPVRLPVEPTVNATA
jgi:CRP-like cAMP-binding protein